MLQPTVNCGTTNVDSLGNISLPQNLVPRNRPPPSPPWGFQTEKTITMDILCRLQPFGILPVIDAQGQTGNVVLCSMIPSFGIKRDLAKHQRNRTKMVQEIRKKKRVAFSKSFSLSSIKPKPCKLKRLQRGPLLKAKKQEIYEKWVEKKWRQQFWRRQRKESTRTLVSQGSESPFQCPLWNCKRKRGSRRENFECGGYRGRHRKRPMSDLSNRSDKSRSPITIRSSPIDLTAK